jgi:hypothetical protein
MMSGDQAIKISYEAHCRPPSCLLGSLASTWSVPGMTFGAATTLIYFTWWLIHPMWGLMWMG